MKSTGFSKKFPASRADVEAAIAHAPDKDRPLTAREEAKWSTGLLIDGGGYEAVRKAFAEKRKPGERGPQVAPTKQLVSGRYSPEVLAFFKAGGAGRQSRMKDALKRWASSHAKIKRCITRDA